MSVKSVQAIINGTTYNLEYNSSTGKYEKTITAPQKSSYNVNSGHYYPITLKVTDDADNQTIISDTDSAFGENLKLTVKEITPPVITVTSPTEGSILSKSSARIQWTVSDNDSGVNPDTISISVNGKTITSGITKSQVSGVYSCYYDASSLPDGTNTITFNASDNDGNSAVQRTLNFVVDTLPPTLSISRPENNLITSNSSVVLAGTTNDATSGVLKCVVNINGGTDIEVSVGSNGQFSKTLTLSEGTNTIVVTVTDNAGKSSSVTRVVTVDAGAPIINEVTISPNPVTVGSVIVISVNASD